jgi:cyclophilin family peptidyl-prolyl cis-trans isomerase
MFFDLAGRKPQRQVRNSRKSLRPSLLRLEDRCVPAAPVINAINSVAPNIPAFKTLFIPVTGSDADGDPITYTVSSSNAQIQATVRGSQHNYLHLSVAGFGDMVYQLFDDLTPHTVDVIGGLVRAGFYDGLTFHRASPNFLIQGGDPTGGPSGGFDHVFDDEFNSSAIYSGSGQLGLPHNSSTLNDGNGTQFFVTIPTARTLDFDFAIFGQLVRGFDVLNAINHVPIGNGDRPLTPVVITRATIEKDTADAVLLLQSTGGSGSGTITVTATDSHGQMSSRNFTAAIVADTVNDPAFLGPVSNQVTDVDTPISFSLTGTDLENDPVTFSAAQLGAANPNVNVSINGNMVTVTPTNGFVGPVKLQLGVSDPGHQEDTQVITVAVTNRRITNVQPAALTFTEGALIPGPHLTLATFHDAAPGASMADYDATINWGDGTVEPGLIDSLGSGDFTVTGSHVYHHAGKYVPEVTIHLADNLGGIVTVVKTTAQVNDADLFFEGFNIVHTKPYIQFTAVVSLFASRNQFDRPQDFAATIDWADGTPPTIGAIDQSTITSTGLYFFQVTGSHTYTSPSPFGRFQVIASVVSVIPAGDAIANNVDCPGQVEVRSGPSDLLAVGADAGGTPHVTVYNPDGSLRFSFLAYDASFRGGVHVATGDINGDGTPDIITGAGAGGGPHVRAFDGKTGQKIADFFAYDASFRGGVFVAVGDINVDGYADIATGAGPGGGPHVRVFDGHTGRLLSNFFAYSPQFTGGVTVAIANSYFNGAGQPFTLGNGQLITGAGPGGGPHVEVFDPLTQERKRSFYAFDSSYAGGVFVAAGDMNGDSTPDIIVSQGQGSRPLVRVFNGGSNEQLFEIMPFPSNQAGTGGARVAAIDRNADGLPELIVGAGSTNPPRVRTINAAAHTLVNEFNAFDPAFLGGVFVG